MLKINIIFVGKKLEEYTNLGINKFANKIKKYAHLNFYKIKPKTNADILKNLKEEAKDILKHIQDGFNIVCDSKGEMFDSISFSNKINNLAMQHSTLNFIIGSSDGLDESVKNKAYLKIAFSKLTFPHELFQVLLLEQIYRAFSILNNHNYHK